MAEGPDYCSGFHPHPGGEHDVGLDRRAGRQVRVPGKMHRLGRRHGHALRQKLIAAPALEDRLGLRQLHLGTGGGIQTAAMAKKKKKKQHSSSSQQPTSIVEEIFQGRVRVTTRQAKRKSNLKSNLGDVEEDDRGGSDDDEDDVETKDSSAPNTKSQIKIEETTIDTQFLQLTLDISEKPLFRDEDGGLVIPQEPLVTVLKKFDGVTFADVLTRNGVVQRRRYALQRLPDYLILHLARFKNNQYSREKNPTIVAFPVKNLDLTDYVQPPKGGRPVPPTAQEVQKMSVRCLPCPA